MKAAGAVAPKLAQASIRGHGGRSAVPHLPEGRSHIHRLYNIYIYTYTYFDCHCQLPHLHGNRALQDAAHIPPPLKPLAFPVPTASLFGAVRPRYALGKDVFLAPYDWRLAGDAHAQRKNGVGGYYQQLQQLIEETVEARGMGQISNQDVERRCWPMVQHLNRLPFGVPIFDFLTHSQMSHVVKTWLDSNR